MKNDRFTTVSNIPTLVDSGSVFRNTFVVESGSAILGTDVILNNLSSFCEFNDDMGTSALSLGVCPVGFISQLSGNNASTIDSVNICLGAAAIDSTSSNASILDLSVFRAKLVNFGGTLTIDTAYGVRVDSGFSDNATLAFGISVDDLNTHNYVPRMVVSGATKTTTNNDIALEIGEAKAFRLGRVTTAQRTAMTNLEGLMVYDTDLSKPYYNDGSVWHQL